MIVEAEYKPIEGARVVTLVNEDLRNREVVAEVIGNGSRIIVVVDDGVRDTFIQGMNWCYSEPIAKVMNESNSSKDVTIVFVRPNPPIHVNSSGYQVDIADQIDANTRMLCADLAMSIVASCNSGVESVGDPIKDAYPNLSELNLNGEVEWVIADSLQGRAIAVAPELMATMQGLSVDDQKAVLADLLKSRGYKWIKAFLKLCYPDVKIALYSATDDDEDELVLNIDKSRPGEFKKALMKIVGNQV